MERCTVILGSASLPSTVGVGDSDRAALGLALLRLGGAVTALCPQGDDAACDYARAAGAAEVNWLIDATRFAPTQRSGGVILIGAGALERLGVVFAGELAEQNCATLAFDVLDLYRNGSELVVTLESSPGCREEWLIAGPAVLVVSRQAVRPPYVSRYRLQQASRLRNAKTTGPVSAPRAAGDMWEPTRPRVKRTRAADALSGLAESRLDGAFGISGSEAGAAAGNVIQADAATCARHLLRFLAHHGFIDRSAESPAADPVERNLRVPVASPVALPGGEVGAASVSARIARGPRATDDLPGRMVRRPRPHAARPEPPGIPARLARRPRLLDDAGGRARRFPRSID